MIDLTDTINEFNLRNNEGVSNPLDQSFAAGITGFLYRLVCVWEENRKRDQSVTAKRYENAYQDDLMDKTVNHLLHQVIVSVKTLS